MSFKKVVLLVLVIAAAGAVYYYRTRPGGGGGGGGGKENTTDSSPIIITDGSIEYRHRSLTAAGDGHTATINVTGLDPHDVQTLWCGSGHGTKLDDCDDKPGSPQSGKDAITKGAWTLRLNDGSTISGAPGSPTVTIHSANPLADAGLNPDGTGVAECTTGAACRLLGGANTLQVEGQPATDLSCVHPGSGHGSHNCIIRIRYCRAGKTCD